MGEGKGGGKGRVGEGKGGGGGGKGRVGVEEGREGWGWRREGKGGVEEGREGCGWRREGKGGGGGHQSNAHLREYGLLVLGKQRVHMSVGLAQLAHVLNEDAHALIRVPGHERPHQAVLGQEVEHVQNSRLKLEPPSCLPRPPSLR